MTFLVILFFFGLSAGSVAKIKGHSFFLWFLIGFCLPIFGTIAALAASNERRADVRMRRCTECPNVMPVYVQVCSRCGADLPYPEPAPEPLPAQGRLFEA
jgi:hypothetical protein